MRNRGLGDIRICALATRIHRRGRVAISRAVGDHTVAIRRDGTGCGTDVGVRTARTCPINSAIDVVAGDARGSAGRP